MFKLFSLATRPTFQVFRFSSYVSSGCSFRQSFLGSYAARTLSHRTNRNGDQAAFSVNTALICIDLSLLALNRAGVGDQAVYIVHLAH